MKQRYLTVEEDEEQPTAPPTTTGLPPTTVVLWLFSHRDSEKLSTKQKTRQLQLMSDFKVSSNISFLLSRACG
ncbi:uncharacterized protein G2W53_044852 [Senna tora]|uniref:Uncharacterized protein n=1 Tax=Senna tora TaxID=362788 RepID=A0A834SE59_9FABA|nr:uncharacterized protein G2W53_044852 [Senna tora]